MRRWKKQIAIFLVAAWMVTAIPDILGITVSAAETAWNILSEKDLVIDEVYNLDDGVLIGRKDGKISTLDKNLQLISKTAYDQIENHAFGGLLVSRKCDDKSEYAILDNKTGQIQSVIGTYDKASPFFAANSGERYFHVSGQGEETWGVVNEKGNLLIPMEHSTIFLLANKDQYYFICSKKQDGVEKKAVYDLNQRKYITDYGYVDVGETEGGSNVLFATKENDE